MTDTRKLKAAMLEAGYTQKKLAVQLGISVYTLYKKLHNLTEFKASEVKAITSILALPDKDAIFFN